MNNFFSFKGQKPIQTAITIVIIMALGMAAMHFAASTIPIQSPVWIAFAVINGFSVTALATLWSTNQQEQLIYAGLFLFITAMGFGFIIPVIVLLLIGAGIAFFISKKVDHLKLGVAGLFFYGTTISLSSLSSPISLLFVALAIFLSVQGVQRRI